MFEVVDLKEKKEGKLREVSRVFYQENYQKMDPSLKVTKPVLQTSLRKIPNLNFLGLTLKILKIDFKSSREIVERIVICEVKI